jgi:hypothetical protein
MPVLVLAHKRIFMNPLNKTYFLPAVIILSVMASCKKAEPLVPTSDPVLKVNAGKDTTIHLPSRTLLLRGSHTLANVTQVQWRQQSGPFCRVENPNQVNTLISQLDTGIYVFEFTATTYTQKTGTDFIQVTVKAALPSLDTLRYVGIDRYYSLISLPENSLNLQAAVYPPVNISSISWSKIAGPASYRLDSPNAYGTRISNLEEGVYQFQFSATSITGFVATSYATVAVVNPSSPNHDVIIPNRAWDPDHGGFFVYYLSLNIYDFIPAGKPVKKVFIRPDCLAQWKELILYENATVYEWRYNIYDNGNKLQIEQSQAYPCGMDTPDVKIVY